MSDPGRASLILASGSPRRRDLLRREQIEFEIRAANIPEQQRPGEAAELFATRMAREKALTVARRTGPVPERTILGADTIVVLDGEVFGKPRDSDHAIAMLSRLAGRTHTVVTAVALVSSATLEERVASVSSEVQMRALGLDEIRSYIASGESLDMAGAYAVQGEGRRLVGSIRGSESNVIGLPMDETLAMLRTAGVVGSAE